jgi:hypothetical protein
MALARWFKQLVKGLAEEVAHMGAHFIRVIVLLLFEFALSWFLALPGLKDFGPIAAPILKLAVQVTVIIFCLHLVSVLALKAWKETRHILQEGGQDWRIAAGILTLVAAVSAGYVLSRRPATQPLLSAEPGTVTTAEVATLDLTKLSERSATSDAMRIPASVPQVELRFQVLVEDGYIYESQLDARDLAVLGFHPDGLFDQRVSRVSLVGMRHRLTVYRVKLGDQASISQVKSILFDVENGD